MAAMGRALAALVWAMAAALPAMAAPARPAVADFDAQLLAPDVRRFASGVVALADHEGLPFAIVDKKRAQLHVFDPRGRLRGSSAVLLGQTRGDRSAPHVGVHTQAGHVPLAERTTPAGRFVSEPGRNLNGEHVVWVDYEAAFAIHRLRPGASYAARQARLATSSADDKRVSLGCVVVPTAFYLGIVERWLGRGESVVYVLPELETMDELLARRAG